MTREKDSSGDDWDRLWSIFHEVRESPPEERAAMLERLAGDDESLEREVAELLASDESRPTIFARVERAVSGLAGVSEEAEGDVSLGKRIGRYRIGRVRGRGGMGVVYEAEQEEPVRRKVALKLLHAGLETPELVARFEAERQALALMSHPDITGILDGGTDELGRPWFAMELLEGVPITAHCAEHRLDVRRRLQLFVRVCRAVHHAHQRGILHRDLKPSNVLVTGEDEEPQVKVIDFGIARALDRGVGATLFTEVGQLVGTPEYMSPEQVEMSPDLDTRTDVYSLGVLLYELLVGATPFDLRSAPFSEVQRVVCTEEPVRPSSRVAEVGEEERADGQGEHARLDLESRRRELAGDLDWIVLKALDKERERRYGSASDLAEDVDRHLRDEPVVAGPPSRSYRIGKFVRRHRVAVLGAAAASLALLAGSVGTTWMAIVARRERGEAEAARGRAEREAEIAEATNRFLQEMLTAADPWRSGTTETAPRDVRVVDVLEEAGARLESSFSEQPAVASALHRTLGETYVALGIAKQGETHLRRAVEVAERSLGPESETTLAARHSLASLHRDLGRLDEAEDDLRAVLEMRRRVLGDEHPETLRAMTSLASVLLDRGALQDARAMLDTVLRGLRRVLGPDDPETLAAMNNLGLVSYRLGDLARAESLLRRTLAGRETLGIDDPGRLSTLGVLGAVLIAQDKLEEAEELMREQAERSESFWGAEHPSSLSAHGNLAAVLIRLGRLEAAEAELVPLVEAQARVLGPRHADTLVSRNNLAKAVLEQGREEEAEERFRRLLADAEATLPPKSLNLALYRSGFGVCLTRRGRFTEAEEQLGKSHGVLEEILGPEHPRTAQTVGRLADLYEAWGDGEEAARLRALHPEPGRAAHRGAEARPRAASNQR